MHGATKRGGGAAASPSPDLGSRFPHLMSRESGLRLGRVESAMERSLDALSVAPIRVDGLRGIKLA